jgi:lipoprotein-anchoring transpeptidase ErfK/SrfK
MKGTNFRMAMVAMAAAMFTVAAAAQQTTTQGVGAPESVEAQVTTQREIVVSLEDRKLALIENGEVKKIYTVSVGKPSTPSPEGTFTIRRRVANPTYQHDGKTILPGPNNPVGSRWMGLSKAGYGIHGTNEPKSIGKAASHGCIRMAKADLEEFYPLVAVGDTVRLIGHRDLETARLFGPAEMPATSAAQPLETAHTDAAPAASGSDAAPAANNAATGATTTVASLGNW